MNISIVGTGYVGLVTGVAFASMGNRVTCVDIDQEKVAALNEGHIPIFEPGLDSLFERVVQNETISFTTDLATATHKADIIFLALPTPEKEDGSADLSYILAVADEIGPSLNSYTLIVDKSTVPVGTADRVRSVIEKSGRLAGIDFDVVSNPEFLREGVALDDFLKPERVVIGTSSDRAAAIMTKLYEPFVRSGNPIIVTDERSAELTKYAANAFLATKISFINEIANLCEKVGADVHNVRNGMGTDSRIGSQFLYPGLGYGGSCFPKDVAALLTTSQQHGYDFRILESVIAVNSEQHLGMMRRIEAELGSDLTGKKIGVWGLAFKANTDDVRESPAHRVIRHLLNRGAEISAYDPVAKETTYREMGDSITYAKDMIDAVVNADALVVATEWAEFRQPDWETVSLAMRRPLVFDGRNLFDPSDMHAAGFSYHCVGRGMDLSIVELAPATV